MSTASVLSSSISDLVCFHEIFARLCSGGAIKTAQGGAGGAAKGPAPLKGTSFGGGPKQTSGTPQPIKGSSKQAGFVMLSEPSPDSMNSKRIGTASKGQRESGGLSSTMESTNTQAIKGSVDRMQPGGLGQSQSRQRTFGAPSINSQMLSGFGAGSGFSKQSQQQTQAQNTMASFREGEGSSSTSPFLKGAQKQSSESPGPAVPKLKGGFVAGGSGFSKQSTSSFREGKDRTSASPFLQAPMQSDDGLEA